MEEVEVYLMDTNVITSAVRTNAERHEKVMNLIRQIGSSYIVLPSIAVAEIQEGLARVDAAGVTLGADASAERARLRQFLFDYPKRQAFDDFAIEAYSLIRARLWIEHATKKPKGKRSKWVEVLPEELGKITGKELGIDERDLQIVSIAAAYGMLLVTFDSNSKMIPIAEAAKALESEGKPVRLRIYEWPP